MGNVMQVTEVTGRHSTNAPADSGLLGQYKVLLGILMLEEELYSMRRKPVGIQESATGEGLELARKRLAAVERCLREAGMTYAQLRNLQKEVWG